MPENQGYQSGTKQNNTSNSSRESNIIGILSALGIQENVVEALRGNLGTKINDKVQDLDFNDVMSKAKEVAGMSREKLTDAAKSNPKLFYAGVAAIITGASLLTASMRSLGGDEHTDVPMPNRPIVE